MKSKWIIAGILIVVLIGLCGAGLFAVWQGFQMVDPSGVHINIRPNNVKATVTEEKTLTVSGPVDLILQNDLGDVSVQTGADGQMHIQAEKTAWGANEADVQEMLEKLKVVIDQNGNQVKISVQQPVQINALNIGPGGGSVKFTITVPKQTKVTLRSSNGDISLTGITGDTDLQTEFGDVSLADVSGVVLVRTNNGKIEARKVGVGGKISLTSEFGAIQANDVDGADVTVDSTNGNLSLRNVKASGLLKVSSDFGSITLGDGSAGTLEVQSQNGKATLENLNVEEKVTVQSNFGDITLTTVDASGYEVITNNGKIKVDKARGAIKAHSEFGEIEVLNAEDATLDLSSNNGSITFAGSIASGPHSVSSEFGNITLTLPAEAGLNIDLQTEFGKIKSDFEITVSGDLDKKHWQGKFNGGGEQLTVKTNNGNITINSK